MLVFTLALAACAPQKQASTDDIAFALLYSVTSQQQNVDKLLWIKEPGADVKAWVEQIAAFNQDVTKQLENWKQSGQIDNLDYQGLPAPEALARKRATKRTTGELLFSEDVDLRVSLIVAQLKALGYCADLSYAIQQEAKEDDIKTIASNWDHRFSQLNAEGMALLEGKASPGNSEDATASGQPPEKAPLRSPSQPRK